MNYYPVHPAYSACLICVEDDVDGEGNPRIRVFADVSFVSEVELEYALLEEAERTVSTSPRVSQWQFSSYISCSSSSSSKQVDSREDRTEESEWKVNKILSLGGPFYE